jgi:hypothetical protein
MKINFGPYPKWFGPYQLADLLKYVGVSESARDIIAEKYIPMAPFAWLHNLLGDRKEKVVIHHYDAWSADHTLAKIIAPLLRMVKQDKQGIPGEFLGEEYNQLVSSKEFWDEKGSGPLHDRADILFKEGIKKWDETLDHMIWAFEEYDNEDWDEPYWTGEYGKFESVSTGETMWNPLTKKDEETFQLKSTGDRTCDWEGRQKHWDRMQEGINLFAKHYSSLWT